MLMIAFIHARRLIGSLSCKQGSIPCSVPTLRELNRDSTSPCLMPLRNDNLPTLDTSPNSSPILSPATRKPSIVVLTPFSSRLLFAPGPICSVFYPIRNLSVHSLLSSLSFSPLLPLPSFLYFRFVQFHDSSLPWMSIRVFLISFTFRSPLHVFN